MKRSLGLAFLLAVLIAPFQAEAKDTRFNLYVVGAFHSNTFETTVTATGVSTETEDDAALGFGAMLSAEFMMGSSSSFELGLGYIQRSSEVTTTLLGVPVVVEATFDVIEIPAIMHFWLGQSASIGIGAYAGIASNDASTAQTEFGATAALRFFLGDMIIIGGRYNLALTDIAEATSTVATITQKNQGFYVLGGVRF